jgi:hypothetical protein
VGGEAPVTPVLSLDSSCLNLSYKPCNNNTQGGLHDLPKKAESWIPKFSGDDGSYGNSHWTDFCDAFHFHQSGQEHPDVFLRLFVSSLTESARKWIKRLPKRSIKNPEDLEQAFQKDCVKRKTWIPFTLNTLIFAKPLVRELGISMIGSTFFSKRSSLVTLKKLSSNTT